jgi:hypothetical protein
MFTATYYVHLYYVVPNIQRYRWSRWIAKLAAKPQTKSVSHFRSCPLCGVTSLMWPNA